MALQINGEYVPETKILAEFHRLGGLGISPEDPHAALEHQRLVRLAEERIIASTLLRQRAVAAGVSVSLAEIERHREEMWGRSSASICGAGVQQDIGEALLVEKYCALITRHEPRPSRTDVKAFYDQRREDFRVPEQVKCMQVIRNVYFEDAVGDAMTAMQAAVQELAQGKAFRQVADRFSDCGGKVLLGWVKRGDMVQEFEDVAFALPKGGTSGIFRSVFGLHLVTVLDKVAAGYRSFEEVHLSLANRMLQMRKDRRVQMEVSEAMYQSSVIHVPEQPTGVAR